MTKCLHQMSPDFTSRQASDDSVVAWYWYLWIGIYKYSNYIQDLLVLPTFGVFMILCNITYFLYFLQVGERKTSDPKSRTASPGSQKGPKKRFAKQKGHSVSDIHASLEHETYA